MIEDIKKLVEGVNQTATAIKSELDALKGSADKQGVEWNTKFDKMVDDMTKKADAVQAQAKAAEEKAAKLEAAMQRMETAEGKKEAEINAKSKAVFREYLRKGDAALNGTGFKVNGDGIEIRSMSTDNNADGGYLVMPELADFMVDRVFETSPIRRVARVITTGSKSLEVVIDDNEADATWVGEGADTSSSTTTPQVGKLTITAHKLACQPSVTTEMLEDPFVDVEAWLQAKIADKIARLQNAAFVSGNGVGCPKGLLSHSAWASAGVYERDKVEQVNLGGASDVTADGLIGLQASLPEIYQGNATWLMKRASYGNVLKLKGADNYFFSTTLLKDGQLSLQLLGRPVVFADDMPAISSNALSFAYGDFGVGYTIVDRVGLQVLKDPYSSKGLVSFYTTARAGGAVTNYQAIKIGKISA